MTKITFPGGNGGGGGGGVSDHGGLAGLGDDDHTQYLLREDFATSGTQASYGIFTHASGAQLSDHGQLDGLSDDDHPQYVLADGTRDITGTQVFTNAGYPIAASGRVEAASGFVIRDRSAAGILLDTDGGPELNVRAGNDSAYGNIRAASIMANTQLRFDTLVNFQSSDGYNIEVSGVSNADANINSASGTFASQIWLSGLAVGNYLGASAAADLSAVAENILPDASGTREIGSPTKVWGSGHLDTVVLYDSAGAGWALTVDTAGILTTTAV